MVAAEHQIDRLVKANRWQKIVIAVTCVLILLLGWVAWNQHQQAIIGCQAGNNYKASQTRIWDELFALSFGYKPPDKHSTVYKLDQKFLAYVHQTNAPRNCPGSWNVLSEGER
jgi:hypothetical protein